MVRRVRAGGANAGEVRGTVVAGFGVASGAAGDPRYPNGTLALQKPVFAGLGLDLNAFFDGTINVSIAPLQPVFGAPDFRFKSVRWTPHHPAEDFSFYRCRFRLESEPGKDVPDKDVPDKDVPDKGALDKEVPDESAPSRSVRWYAGLVYRPSPDTKAEHYQDNSVLELLAPYVDGIDVGTGVMISFDGSGVHVA